jgi:hypothetical protein
MNITSESDYTSEYKSMSSGVEAASQRDILSAGPSSIDTGCLYNGYAQQSEVRPPYGEIPIMDSSSTSLREVRISPLSSGFMVTVGCQSIAVETSEKLIAALASYLDNPAKFEKKWYSKPNRNRLENILG